MLAGTGVVCLPTGVPGAGDAIPLFGRGHDDVSRQQSAQVGGYVTCPGLRFRTQGLNSLRGRHAGCLSGSTQQAVLCEARQRVPVWPSCCQAGTHRTLRALVRSVGKCSMADYPFSQDTRLAGAGAYRCLLIAPVSSTRRLPRAAHRPRPQSLMRSLTRACKIQILKSHSL